MQCVDIIESGKIADLSSTQKLIKKLINFMLMICENGDYENLILISLI